MFLYTLESSGESSKNNFEMASAFHILHWPLFLSDSAINQGEILHSITYRLQFKSLDVYMMKRRKLMIGWMMTKVQNLFSKILEILKECKRGDELFSLNEVKKFRYDQNCKHAYDSKRLRSKRMSPLLAKKSEIKIY